MHLDISRDTFHSRNHYLRVLQEQGRVLLDADANEQTAILLHHLHRLARDLLGGHWGPQLNCGFGVAASPDDNVLFTLSAGSYYVGGRLCENGFPGDPALPLLKQPDPPLDEKEMAQQLKQKPLLLYLDVWERLVLPFEERNLADPALERLDALSRTKLVWQVRAQQIQDQVKVDALISDLKNLDFLGALDSLKIRRDKSTGKLSVRLMQAPAAAPPCPSDAENQLYVGAENQLYRVEVHRGGNAFVKMAPGDQPNKDNATFKWSRENGSVVFPVAEWTPASEQIGVRLAGIHPDDRYRLQKGDWVEYVDRTTLSRPMAGDLVGVVPNLFQVIDVNQEDPAAVTLAAPKDLAQQVKTAFKTEHPGYRAYLRRWDQRPQKGEISASGPPVKADDNALWVVANAKPEDGGWLDLENGIQVQFAGGSYNRGDYWLIPARYATATILWPQEKGKPVAVSPHNAEHHYAPLAVLPKDGGLTDCRRQVKTSTILTNVTP
jgi:hypothetical protein